MKKITTLSYKGRTFEILKRPDGYYIAIDHKYIDKDGKLTRSLNGFDMHADKDCKLTIKSTMFWVDVDELQAQGMDRIQAVVQVSKR